MHTSDRENRTLQQLLGSLFISFGRVSVNSLEIWIFIRDITKVIFEVLFFFLKSLPFCWFCFIILVLFFSVSNALTNPKLAASKSYFQTICLHLKHYNLFLQGLQDRCDALFDPIPFMTNDIRITSPSNTLKPGNQYSIPLLINNNQSRPRFSDVENERHKQTFCSRDTT